MVYSREKELTAPLGGDMLLNCGFRQQELGQDVSVEWWLQHRGSGKRILDLKMTGSQEQRVAGDSAASHHSNQCGECIFDKYTYFYYYVYSSQVKWHMVTFRNKHRSRYIWVLYPKGHGRHLRGPGRRRRF